MVEKIKKLYDNLEILMRVVVEKEFVNVFKFNNIECDDKMFAKCSCSRYVKFLINDFKSLEKRYGEDIYSIVDAYKLNVMFSISETCSWFSRKELIDFVEKVIISEIKNKGF